MRTVAASDVTVTYYRGLPRITVPLPSRREHCSFTMKPITNTVGNFLEMLKAEDLGIDRACLTSLGEINHFFKGDRLRQLRESPIKR